MELFAIRKLASYHFKITGEFLRILIFVLILFCQGLFVTHAAETDRRDYSYFSVDLPPGWDGEEKKGFVSDNPAEYLLALGKTDEEKNEVAAQITIYVLPNKDGLPAKEAAMRLAEAQGGSTEPEQSGGLWTFKGEPRTNLLRGQATTMVNTDQDVMLIIIVQDPENLGATEILSTLRATDSKIQKLLGR